MHRVGCGLLASWLLLGACAPVPSRVATRAGASARPAGVKPTTAPSAKPTVKPTPSVPMAELAGQLRIDAAYVISNNAGSLIANNGGSVLKVGSGIISDNGLGLISDNGLGVIANNGGSYRVLAAPLTIGTMLPVAGMTVIAVNLLDGQPIGEAVTSDAAGRFKVAVPKDLVGNTLVQARIPNTTDARMQYDVVTKPQASETAVLAVDEDEAALSRFLRRAYAGKVEELILRGKDAMAEGGTFYGAAEQNPIVGVVLEKMIAELEAVKAKDLPEKERKALAQRVCDILLYHVKLEEAAMDRTFYTGPEEPAMTAMRELLKQYREGATRKMAAEAAFFATQPYLVRTNEELRAAGKPPFEVKKPADLNDYLVEHVMLVLVGNRSAVLDEVATSIGLPETVVSRFNAAALGMLNTIGLTLVADSKAKEDITKAIQAVGADAR